jgi:hypothetical protein
MGRRIKFFPIAEEKLKSLIQDSRLRSDALCDRLILKETFGSFDEHERNKEQINNMEAGLHRHSCAREGRRASDLSSQEKP